MWKVLYVDEHQGTLRELIGKSITEGARDQVAKGELCIDDGVVRQALRCKRVGFEERLAFVAGMNLDIFTVAPVYPEQGKRLPRPDECLWPDLKKWVAETPLYTCALLDGAFEWGLRVLGFQDFLILDRTSPVAFNNFIKAVEDLNQSLIRFLAESGIDAIIIGDDIAYNKGLMLSPAVLREHFFPSLSKQVAVAAHKGLPVFYHSDGNYRDVVGDIVNAGFNGLHCIDRDSGMDLSWLYSEIGDKLCLWGHLDASAIVQAGDPVLLKDWAMSIRRFASGKKFILGTNSGMFEGMDVEGLRILYQAVAAQD